MKKSSILLFPLLAFLVACGNKSDQKVSNSSNLAETTKVDRGPVIYLEGCYATSTAPGKGFEYLFDGDDNTYWQTEPGAGPDEGLMLYFQNALPIASIEIVTGDGVFAQLPKDGEKPILIYTNGQVATAGSPNQSIAIQQNGLVKSLFIRFPLTGKEASETLKDAVQRLKFPATAFIAIRELKVLNDKGEILNLAPPQRVNGRVSASSTLMPEPAYSPANLFDSRKEFVWAEGASTAGEMETLNFEFDEAVNITAIQIWNGYQRSDEHFKANTRLRDFDFGDKNGTLQTYTMRDTKAGQKIELKAPIKGSAFELKIKSVYPGTSYKDLAISDLVFYDGAKPFVLRSALPETYSVAVRAKATNSVLAELLDKRICNQMEDGASTVTQSLILRTDGTFVLYSKSMSDEDADISSFADGNWELLANNKIKVFGKWTDLVTLPEYYKGTEAQNPTRIFKDVLSIDAQKVVGEKMIGTFYLK